MMEGLRWLIHSLMVTQKTEYFTLSDEQLRQLHSIKHDGW
jgi:hypothetical protein